MKLPDAEALCAGLARELEPRVGPNTAMVGLHTGGAWQSTLRVADHIGLTTSKDILEAVGRGEGPQQLLVTLGYAGWSPGQLEHEIGQNAWLTVEARDGILFDTPAEERLPAAMELLGLDFARLQDEAGHA